MTCVSTIGGLRRGLRLLISWFAAAWTVKLPLCAACSVLVVVTLPEILSARADSARRFKPFVLRVGVCEALSRSACRVWVRFDFLTRQRETRAQNTCKATGKGMDWALFSGELLRPDERLRSWVQQDVLSMPCWGCDKWYVLRASAFEKDHSKMKYHATKIMGWTRTRKTGASYWSCPLHGYYGNNQTWEI